MTDYLSVIEIISIHKELIDRYGGIHGIRDAGAIEAACHRPQSGYYDDIISEASALMESLALNHPFLDGNKRVAFAATDIFLRINGHYIEADSASIYKEIIDMFEKHDFEFKNINIMLRKYIKEYKLHS